MKMKHAILTATGVLLAALCLSPGVVSQSDVALETRSAKLQQLARDLRARDAGNRREVREFAQRVGIPARRVLPNGKVLEFQRFAPGIGPVIYVTYNLDAADSVSTDEVWPGGTAGLDLDGNGMTVGEWDGGAVAEHPDFDTRLTQVDGATEMSNHSTHVAGTLIGSGDGNYLQAKGMAYAAQLHAYDWNSDTAEMAIAAASGMLVSNHSYGIAAGWLLSLGLSDPRGASTDSETLRFTIQPPGCTWVVCLRTSGGGSAATSRGMWKTPTSATTTQRQACGTRSPTMRPTTW